ncbi:penicillin-binding protein 1C [Fluviicoccus keumensis]|uniref:peptidoglycan glycosyltransferase n=1 Tax=Fluviicoccus keumensis TaxID=1435465 RepID=A0A4Q7ZA55_9GAMM|nr:penicillin-binding protein 1C [Fluviicoccus keumensis]RZU47428.1 penicillin-binding protein 1C [Fluviicoccus keumensis]
MRRYQACFGLLWLLAVSSVRAETAVPDFAVVKAGWTSSYAALLDRHGEVLIRQRQDKSAHRLDWTPLDRVSPALVDALIFVEDRDFYRHHGVDWGAFSRAALKYLTGQRTRGASTLSMQTAALLDPTLAWRTGGRPLDRKWRQLRAARALDARWGKDRILEAYLNLTQWRGDLQGIDAASQALFGKRPAGLDRADSILLVSLLSSPNMTSEQAAKRACVLIAAGYDADCPTVHALADSRLRNRSLGLDDDPALLSLASRLLTAAGRDVTTTLDRRLQHVAGEALREQLLSLQAQQANGGAVLVLDNRSGEVLAYVGNSGLDEDSRWVDSVQAQRQAGSTLKPFLYGLALEQNRLTAATVLEDSPVNIATERGLYVPQNYEHDFKGPVTVRTALASSLNVPAVRTLQLTGVDGFWQVLRAYGFGLKEDAEFYGSALALGGADITLWELANAYRALANGGVWSPARLTTGEAINPPPADAPRLSPATTFILSSILSDRNARSLTFGYENPLATPFWTAVKTGTSKDMRDNWCVGFSRHYTVAVWVGNMQGRPMREVSGISGAAPVWNAVISHLEQGGDEVGPPPAPAGLLRQRVAFEGVALPPVEEWFAAGTQQDTVHYQADTVAEIVYPVDGAIIALDPDMPARVQRVVLRARTGGENLDWWLNGRKLAPAGEPLSWAPKRGRHRLELRTGDGEVRAKAAFEVRGVLSSVGSASH